MRDFDAAMRHLLAWHNGERSDTESGLSHLAHAACCLLFLASMKGCSMREDVALSGAVLSPCSRYRYRLWREWCPTLPTGVFVMLNPSTADDSINDPTIRRCMQFARAWGWGRIEVVNVFAFRTAYPRALVQAHRDGVDVLGPERDAGLSAAFDRARVVVAAWGANWFAQEHARGVLSLVPPGLEIVCLGKTQGGFPRHPLYMRADTPLSTFSMESL